MSCKDVIIFEATKAEIPVILVTSFSHYSNAEQPKGVETIYVDSGADAADYRIMQLAQKEDLIITQDYGLASLALAKGCIVLHHKGYKYTNDNIEQLLQTRYLSAMVRKVVNVQRDRNHLQQKIKKNLERSLKVLSHVKMNRLFARKTS